MLHNIFYSNFLLFVSRVFADIPRIKYKNTSICIGAPRQRRLALDCRRWSGIFPRETHRDCRETNRQNKHKQQSNRKRQTRGTYTNWTHERRKITTPPTVYRSHVISNRIEVMCRENAFNLWVEDRESIFRCVFFVFHCCCSVQIGRKYIYTFHSYAVCTNARVYSRSIANSLYRYVFFCSFYCFFLSVALHSLIHGSENKQEPSVYVCWCEMGYEAKVVVIHMFFFCVLLVTRRQGWGADKTLYS